MDIFLNVFSGSIYISGEIWFDFVTRLLVNIVSTFILIRFIYYQNNGQASFLFTLFLMGMMIFLIASTLDQIDLDMGLALGLFAIFGIIRFRSPSVDLKEMTYLFLVIGMSMINALVAFTIADWFGLIIANFIILSAAFFMEMYKPRQSILKKSLVFTPSDFSVLNNSELLVEEIRKQTGINVIKATISRINKSKEEVTVWIYFYRSRQEYDALEEEGTGKEPGEADHWKTTSSNDFYEE